MADRLPAPAAGESLEATGGEGRERSGLLAAAERLEDRAGGAKLLVRCDVEGASGVVSPEQTSGGEAAFGRRMLMADLRALLEGLRSGGAREVVVYDAHGLGLNVDPAELPPYASLISGRPPYRCDWPGGLDASCQGLILLGAHARAGAAAALMAHTYDPEIQRLRLNGRSLGEIGLEAAVAGDLSVPLLMVTGDAAAVAEGCDAAPEALGVVVKDAVDPRAALCYPLSVTTDLIRRAAQQLAQQPPRPAPLRFDAPVTLEVDLASGGLLDRMRELYPRDVRRQSRVSIKGATVTEVWAGFQSRLLKARGLRR